MSSRNTGGDGGSSPALSAGAAQGKLVRDLIPEIIRRDGGEPRTYVADDEEYVQRLKDKLQEELAEFLVAEHVSAQVEELADVLEVVHALARHLGFTPAELDVVRVQKALGRGAFQQRIVWTGNA
ncbi:MULTISPECIES: nucleoside triphosphate pyrophosphohydrolase [Streptomyces]|uniref:nucleoside triphosphate pyrophosphohydrolase n=1 Tax=Streptomyces TaxID=1883 RepID=UPI0028A5DAB8|nr:nucleoside triphosphate pyrophosphohydrolase [Streptomyces lonarensis]